MITKDRLYMGKAQIDTASADELRDEVIHLREELQKVVYEFQLPTIIA